jgi:hypothetical protein
MKLKELCEIISSNTDVYINMVYLAIDILAL